MSTKHYGRRRATVRHCERRSNPINTNQKAPRLSRCIGRLAMICKGTLCALVLLVSNGLGAYTPTNVDMPYDNNLTQCIWTPATSFQAGVRGLSMLQTKAFNGDEKQVPVTQIYGSQYNGEKESSLAMLEGNLPGTSLHALANRLRGAQDGTRGMFVVNGDMTWNQVCLDLTYRLSMIKLPGIFSLAIHIPFIDASIRNVTWTSQTLSQTLQDDRVQTLLVSDENSLSAFVQNNSGLDIGSQQRAGVGDVVGMLYWQGHFTQYQRRLRDVFVQFRIGIQLPTSHKVDVDKVFDVDFGRDGSAAIPMGAGLRLDLGGGIRVGGDVGMTMIIRQQKEWRLKTSWAQTPWLLLSKGFATREYGPEWIFTVYGQTEIANTGLFCTAGYRFFKHTDSTFYPQDDVMSALLINSSPTVDACESHNVLAGVSFVPPHVREWKFLPEANLQIAMPFNGKSVMSGVVLSGGVSLKF